MERPSPSRDGALSFGPLSFLAPAGFTFAFGILLVAGAGSEATREALTWRGLLTPWAWLLILGGGLGCTLILRAMRRDAWWSGGPRSWPLSMRVLALAVVCVAIYLPTMELRELNRVATGVTDFRIIFGAAQVIAQGLNPYTDGPAGYFYPPTLAALWAPLTVIPAAWASVAWFGFKLWLLSWAVRWVVELLPLRRFRPESVPWIILGTIACTGRFWMADLRYGNTNILVMALVVCSLHAEVFGARRRAGICLALAASVKVVPLVLVVWFVARGSWKALAWMCGALVVLWGVVPALAPVGLVELTTSYWQHGVAGKLAEDASQPDNQSLLGALSRTPLSGDLVRMLWIAGCSLLVTVVGVLSWWTRYEGRECAAVVAAMCPALVLTVSPGSWVVHYGMVMLPLAMVMAHAYGSSSRRGLIWVFWAANLAFTVSGWSRPTVRMSIEQSWFLIALLVLFGCLAWLAFELRGTTRIPSSQDFRSN